jgi:hypothetical protein
MIEWPPEFVQTPCGLEPFKQAVQWHLPTILRWMNHNRDASRTPDGSLVGAVLQCAADKLECRGNHDD